MPDGEAPSESAAQGEMFFLCENFAFVLSKGLVANIASTLSALPFSRLDLDQFSALTASFDRLAVLSEDNGR